jgi:hypothetical protein
MLWYSSNSLIFNHFLKTMRAILSTLIVSICHQALALPVASPVSSTEIPYKIATPQTLDSRSSNHDEMIADRDTPSLQHHILLWTSTPLDIKLSVLLNIATATTLQLANGWLTWQVEMMYEQSTNLWQGTVYSTPEAIASDLTVCVNEFEPNLSGSTGGTLWTEGKMTFETTWRSVPLSKSVTVFWQASIRFYQKKSLGPAISSIIMNTIDNVWGYELAYDDNWVCTTKVLGEPTLAIEQTQFSTCRVGQTRGN